MNFSDLNLESAMWISPELDDAAVPRHDNGRFFSSVTAGDADFATANDFGPHAGYLRKCFFCTPGTDNILYVSAHGVYEIYINNKKISDAVLAPGPCNYYMKQPLQRFDVTPYLKDGENEILAVLGNGWYRGSCGPAGQKVLFGKDLSLYLQLLVDGRQLLVSDTSWDASTDGPIRGNDLEQGEIYIAGKELCFLRKAREVRLTKELLYLAEEVPVCRHETFPGKFLHTPDGSTVIDFGQNLAGVVDISLKNAPEGGHLALICGETLDEAGNFTLQNFEPGHRHFEGGIRQEERFVTAAGDCAYSPAFCIFGFRYARVVADFPVNEENASFTAVAIYSDMQTTAEFTSSDPNLNRLFQNCLWSQKSAFCGIPATAPTSGRAGETGPAASFAHTGLRLMASGPVYEKWLTEVSIGQHKNGRIPAVCPPVKGFSPRQYRLSQSTGWGDACILVPWEMYLYTGEISILSRFYPMMQKWYEYLIRRAAKKPRHSASPALKGRKNKKYERYVIDCGFDWGERSEPGQERADSRLEAVELSDIATAYFAYDGLILGKIAQALAEHQPDKGPVYKRLISESVRYTETGEKARDAYIHAFTDDGVISSNRQSLYVRPLVFGLLPENRRQAAADALNELVLQNGCLLNTGSLTTPDLCRVLAENGHADTACCLLLNEEAPGWLYEVKHGATTIWEDWFAVTPDGIPVKPLNSCGSAAAVASFLLEDVAGIHYRHGKLVLQPLATAKIQASGEVHAQNADEATADVKGQQIAGTASMNRAVSQENGHYLESASACLDSPEGRISCGWQYASDDSVIVRGCVPAGLSAEVRLPDGSVKPGVSGEFSFTCKV